MDNNPSLIEFIWDWIKNISVPGFVLFCIQCFRWASKKDRQIQDSFASVTASVENLKTNHLHHLQETLDGIKVGQDKMVEQMSENTRDIIAAQNSSKDAIVNAILATRK